MSKFSKGEAVSFGWNTVKNNYIFISISIVFFLVGLIFDYLAANHLLFIGYIIRLVFWFISIVIGMGLIKICLKFVDGQKGEFEDLISCLPFFLNYFISYLLYMLIVLGGFILLIVPGIIWGIKYQYFSYSIIDKNLGPVEALKNSSAITTGAKWDLFVFGLLLGLINLLGVIIFGIGLLVTIPITMLAQAYVYRKLSGQTQVVEVRPAVPAEAASQT